MLADFAEMYQTTVLFALGSLVLFPASFVFLVPFDYHRELVSFLGVKRSRGRAHLTSLRERRRSPDGNPGAWRRKFHKLAENSEVCDARLSRRQFRISASVLVAR